MGSKGNISTDLKAKVSAWLLMTMVLFTIVPFNLFHSHVQGKSTILVNKVEDHITCDHQFHIAEEQELCFLCHFAFLTSYKNDVFVQIEDRCPSFSADGEKAEPWMRG